MQDLDPRRYIIPALDMSSLDVFKRMIDQLLPYADYFKIGLEIASLVGEIPAMDLIHLSGGKVFLDLKYGDIPNTVRQASQNLSSQRAEMYSVHANMGLGGMIAAREGRDAGFNPNGTTNYKTHVEKSRILAVTVLTSLTEDEAFGIYGKSIKDTVLGFARWAVRAGLEGVVCSPQELVMLRGHDELNSLIKITPGVRSDWYEHGDQMRVMTPAQAILLGADGVVIGRQLTQPITGTTIDAIKRTSDEVAEALVLRGK